jgi:hypothetical protein
LGVPALRINDPGVRHRQTAGYPAQSIISYNYVSGPAHEHWAVARGTPASGDRKAAYSVGFSFGLDLASSYTKSLRTWFGVLKWGGGKLEVGLDRNDENEMHIPLLDHSCNSL